MRFRSIATAALWCCTTPVFAQSLTRVQILGLQQQLRDDGCGVAHVTGRMDATTKHAVQSCMQKYKVSSGGASALLTAMNIGLGPSDAVPSMATANGQSSIGAGGTVNLPPDSVGMNDSTQAGQGTRKRRGMGHKGRTHRRSHGNMGGRSSDSASGHMRDTLHQDSTMTPQGTSPMGNPSGTKIP